MADIEELQEKLTEGSDEEEDLGSNEPQIDLSFLEGEQEPSVAERAAIRAAAIGEKAGGAARGLLTRIGSKIESPTPPDDDLSDLFEGPDMDRDNDVYIKDLVTVSEEDTFGEGGADMSDILEVTEEDVMGTEDVEGDESAVTPKRVVRRPLRSIPPTGGLSGLQI